MRRRFFVPLAVASLVIGVTTLVLWGDSYWHWTSVNIAWAKKLNLSVELMDGRVFLRLQRSAGFTEFLRIAAGRPKVVTGITVHSFLAYTMQFHCRFLFGGVDFVFPICLVTAIAFVSASLFWRYRFKRSRQGFDVDEAPIIASFEPQPPVLR